MIDANKIVATFLLFILSASALKCTNICDNSGRLIYSELINQRPEKNVQNFTITFNTQGEKIQCINITQLKYFDTWCEIFDGGVGYNFTKIHLFSPGHGIKYNIQIFGSQNFIKKYVYYESYSTTPLVIILLLILIVFVVLVKLFIHNWNAANLYS